MNLKKMPLFGTAFLLLGSEKAHCMLRSPTAGVAAAQPAQMVDVPTVERQEGAVTKAPIGTLEHELGETKKVMTKGFAAIMERLDAMKKTYATTENAISGVNQQEEAVTKPQLGDLTAMEEGFAAMTERFDAEREDLTAMKARSQEDVQSEFDPRRNSQDDGASQGHN
eukprot:GHVS01037358.1.p1 GENE.GHVS01037358.1~~GHVS01037358.1.p1  ORF type:complete len:168 (-),score=34.98 GHVS01037358.1:151-654(-)